MMLNLTDNQFVANPDYEHALNQLANLSTLNLTFAKNVVSDIACTMHLGLF